MGPGFFWYYVWHEFCSTTVMGKEEIYDIKLDKKTHMAFPSESPLTNYKAL